MSVETMEFGPIVVAFHDGVLRPRPWTLMQASWAADLARDLPSGPILELCSGAGHIGQAAAVLTGRRLVQVDNDPQACALAETNARANLPAAQVEVRCADLEEALGVHERFPLVLADPPYLPEGEVEADPEDPTEAIDGGPDGLRLLRRCLTVAGAHIDAHGAVLLQTLGAVQISSLTPEMHAAGLDLVHVRTADERRAIAHLRSVPPPFNPRGALAGSMPIGARARAAVRRASRGGRA